MENGRTQNESATSSAMMRSPFSGYVFFSGLCFFNWLWSRKFCKQMFLLLLGFFFFFFLLLSRLFVWSIRVCLHLCLLLKLQKFNALFRYNFELCRNFVVKNWALEHHSKHEQQQQHQNRKSKTKNMENYKLYFRVRRH